MDQLYITPGAEFCNSPMAFAQVPELIHSYDDNSTDPSPSPPMISYNLDTYSNTFASPSTYPQQYTDMQPTQLLNSIEFTDLTHPQIEDHRRRRSNTTNPQDKETVSNMRIRRRAQNRASQRAFRERKEKHVQHLEAELSDLENKHRTLAKSYTDLDSTHALLKHEVKQLKGELEDARTSREGSVNGGESGQQATSNNFFDPFASDGFFGAGGVEMGY